MRLRDKGRNKELRRVVSCESDRGPVVLCESDDIVIEYSDNLNAPPHCLFWFVKQNDNNMLPEERARILDLRRGERVSSTQRSETRARAERELEALQGLLRFYLG